MIVAMTLLGRRLLGELQPLTPTSLLVAGVMMVTLATAWRLGWTRRAYYRPWHLWLGWLGPMAMLLCGAMALSVPGSSGWALLALWSLIVGVEAGTAHLYWRSLRQRNIAVARPLDHWEVDEVDEEEPATALPPGISQQLTRQVTEGVEALTCLLRVTFAVGEQTHTVHVAFCPPLEGELTAHCAQIDGAASEIKITLVETFGARLDVKRRGPLSLSDEAVVLLEVRGTTAN